MSFIQLNRDMVISQFRMLYFRNRCDLRWSPGNRGGHTFISGFFTLEPWYCEQAFHSVGLPALLVVFC